MHAKLSFLTHTYLAPITPLHLIVDVPAILLEGLRFVTHRDASHALNHLPIHSLLQDPPKERVFEAVWEGKPASQEHSSESGSHGIVQQKDWTTKVWTSCSSLHAGYRVARLSALLSFDNHKAMRLLTGVQ